MLMLRISAFSEEAKILYLLAAQTTITVKFNMKVADGVEFSGGLVLFFYFGFNFFLNIIY